MSERFTLRGGRPLRGRVRVPGDKSVSLRALLLGTIANGTTTIFNLSTGHDVTALLAALQNLGSEVIQDQDTEGVWRLDGGHLRTPSTSVDLRSSPTALRLLIGTLAGQPATVTLTAAADVSALTLGPVVRVLRMLGAEVSATGKSQTLPVTLTGGRLRGSELRLLAPSAQVKSVALFGAVQTNGRHSVVTEPMPTRDHSEEMLRAFGAQIERVDPITTVVHPSILQGRHINVPGDPSHAAYWLVAAALVPDSDVEVVGIHVGGRRAGFLTALLAMGADVEVTPEPGSTTGDVRVRYNGRLKAVEIGTEVVPTLLDEIPVLAVAAAMAQGTTTFTGVSSTRSCGNRLEPTAQMLRAFSADVEQTPDTLIVHGRETLVPAIVTCGGDHHIILSAAVAALTCKGPSTLTNWARAGDAYPTILEDLHLLTEDAVAEPAAHASPAPANPGLEALS